MAPTTLNRLVLLMSSLVLAVGVIDGIVSREWDFLAVFAAALALQLLLLARLSVRRPAVPIRRTSSPGSVTRRPLRGEPMEAVADRAISSYQAGFCDLDDSPGSDGADRRNAPQSPATASEGPGPPARDDARAGAVHPGPRRRMRRSEIARRQGSCARPVDRLGCPRSRHRRRHGSGVPGGRRPARAGGAARSAGGRRRPAASTRSTGRSRESNRRRRCARRHGRRSGRRDRSGLAASPSARRPRSRTSLIRRSPASTGRSSTSTPAIPTPSSTPCCRCSRRSGIRQARTYRTALGIDDRDAAMAAVVMAMVPAERAGVAFTVDPADESGRGTRRGGRRARRDPRLGRTHTGRLAARSARRTPGRPCRDRGSPSRSRVASSRSPEPRRTSSGHGPTERSGSSRRGRSPPRDRRRRGRFRLAGQRRRPDHRRDRRDASRRPAAAALAGELAPGRPGVPGGARRTRAPTRQPRSTTDSSGVSGVGRRWTSPSCTRWRRSCRGAPPTNSNASTSALDAPDGQSIAPSRRAAGSPGPATTSGCSSNSTDATQDAEVVCVAVAELRHRRGDLTELDDAALARYRFRLIDLGVRAMTAELASAAAAAAAYRRLELTLSSSFDDDEAGRLAGMATARSGIVAVPRAHASAAVFAGPTWEETGRAVPRRDDTVPTPDATSDPARGSPPTPRDHGAVRPGCPARMVPAAAHRPRGRGGRRAPRPPGAHEGRRAGTRRRGPPRPSRVRCATRRPWGARGPRRHRPADLAGDRGRTPWRGATAGDRRPTAPVDSPDTRTKAPFPSASAAGPSDRCRASRPATGSRGGRRVRDGATSRAVFMDEPDDSLPDRCDPARRGDRRIVVAGVRARRRDRARARRAAVARCDPRARARRARRAQRGRGACARWTAAC